MTDAPAGRVPYLTIVSPGGDRDRIDIANFPFLIGRQVGNQLVLRLYWSTMLLIPHKWHPRYS